MREIEMRRRGKAHGDAQLLAESLGINGGVATLVERTREAQHEHDPVGRLGRQVRIALPNVGFGQLR